MILLYLILILLVGGFLAGISGKRNGLMPRIIAFTALFIDLLLLVWIWYDHPAGGNTDWWVEYRHSWIPTLGISLHFAMDGLSFILVLLTVIIGLISVLISWREIKTKQLSFT